MDDLGFLGGEVEEEQLSEKEFAERMEHTSNDLDLLLNQVFVQKRLARENRAAFCGFEADRQQPDGTISQYPWYCRCPEFCVRCRRHMAKMLELRIKKAIREGKVWVATIGDDEKDAIVRRIKRVDGKYYRVPTASGHVLFCDTIDPLHGLSATRVMRGNMSDLDFESLIVTPVGTRKAGTLGAPDPRKKNERSFDVKLPYVIVTNLNGKERGDAAAKTIEDTPITLGEPTPDTIQRACLIRYDAYKENISELGGRVEHEGWRTLAVDLDSYNWINTGIKQPQTVEKFASAVPLLAPSSV